MQAQRGRSAWRARGTPARETDEKLMEAWLATWALQEPTWGIAGQSGRSGRLPANWKFDRRLYFARGRTLSQARLARGCMQIGRERGPGMRADHDHGKDESIIPPAGVASASCGTQATAAARTLSYGWPRKAPFAPVEQGSWFWDCGLFRSASLARRRTALQTPFQVRTGTRRRAFSC